MDVPGTSKRSDAYSRERLEPEVAAARNWADLMRRLGLSPSGGQRRVLQEHVTRHGLDTSHFTKRSPWRKYPDAAIAQAAASSSSLREVALKLGATPATGTLSHIRRRIHAAGIDIGHFPGIDRPELDLPFTPEELRTAAAAATSLRGPARRLGVPDDSRSRATLSRMLADHHIGIGHFSYRRAAIPEDELTNLVRTAGSYADVMRGLGMEVNDTNHRRVRRAASRLDLDTSHFKRRSWGRPERPAPAPHRTSGAGSPARAGRTDEQDPPAPGSCRDRGALRMRGVRQYRGVAGTPHHLADRPCQRELAGQSPGEPALPVPQLPCLDGNVVSPEERSPPRRAARQPRTLSAAGRA